MKLTITAISVYAGLLFVVLAGAKQAAGQAQPSVSAPAASVDEFWERLGTFYKQDWTGTAPSSPAPPRRGLAQPLDSPPFPSSDWSYGGSPVLGEADSNVYPLMTAIDGAQDRTKLYGWIDTSVNGSTSGRNNLPEVDDVYANRLEMDQLVIYVERLPDTVQREHFDWGYHFTGLYGIDYKSTTDKGYLSSQLLVHNHEYGFDPSLEYVDLYFPRVAQGMNLRVGRFISIPGIEAQLSPSNYFFSHSLLYSVDPFTDTGVLATVQLNAQWIVQAGITASHDVAPWTVDAQPSATACVSYQTKSVRDDVYACINGINDGEYAYNNLQQYDMTWYHKFSKKWHAATEAYVMYQKGVPDVANTLAIEANTYGAVCRPGQERCLAPEWAVENYLNREIDAHSFIGFRSDFLNDKKGQRTGFATKYTENTLSYTRWFGSTVQLRPEVRFGHSWDRAGYDGGTHLNQFTVASDLIVHF